MTKIVRLTANNIKRLHAVEIAPDGNIVVISGKNGAGKTSILDSIWFALAGGAALRDTPHPIREGEEHAEVTLDMGDFTVTRKWNGEKPSTLTVMSKDGAKYSSPQAFLDERLGALSFDPLAFSAKSPREQLADLLALVELPFDPEELDAKRLGIFDQRTEIGRDFTHAKGRVADIPRPTEEPGEEVSFASLTLEYDEARKVISQRRLVEDSLDQSKAQVDKLRGELAHAEAIVKLNERTLAETPEAPDISELQERMERVEQDNQDIRDLREAWKSWAAHDLLRDQVDALTGQLAALDASKAEALAGAKMPIDGLAFDEEGVTYNGIPFRQCSSGERLRVSLAMSMAMNPEIRVIRITDGSLLDGDNLRMIEDMAYDEDYQVWLEVVSDGSGVGFQIEDGSVKS